MEIDSSKFYDIDHQLCRKSYFATNDFEPCQELRGLLQDVAKVLVIGAGGLGCEILKDLALSGFKDIHVIDLDKIDITNLNRQFLFRKHDVGEYKAKVAAEFIMKRCPGVKITPYTDMIQQHQKEFYEQFHLIIAGLDNIEARRWMNSMLHSLVEFDSNKNPDPSTQRPMIDGGTEGFKGQARVIIPFKTGCFECSLGSLPPQIGFPMCTIRETPRLPEHCIQYAYIISWEEEFGKKAVDKDSPQDMTWIYEKAKERANIFGIQGVTYQLTMGVVKNIIPAIASTNALVSAVCVNEAFKLLTGCNHHMNNYMMYMGQTGVNTHTFEYQREENCYVCSRKTVELQAAQDETLKGFLQKIKDQMRLQNPTLESSTSLLYIPKPPNLEEKHRFKLDLTFGEYRQLKEQGFITGDNREEYEITDPAIPTVLYAHINIE